MNANRVLLLQLSERTSAKGNPYLSGWLGKASVVAFRGEDDRHGNPVWDVFVSTPEPRPEAKSPNFGASAPGDDRRSTKPPIGDLNRGAPAKPSASPVARGDGWRGPSAYRR